MRAFVGECVGKMKLDRTPQTNRGILAPISMFVKWAESNIKFVLHETLVNFYQTTRCYNPEDSNLHTHRRENLKSYLILYVFLKKYGSWAED
jgi:hypothetical protein